MNCQFAVAQPGGFGTMEDQGRPHFNRSAMSSNGTPLVSGTRHLTQTSWSIIMQQKKRRTHPGGNDVTIFGKKVVSSAAKNQWVKHPSDWPSARYLSGKISAMNTQITAPWPM